MTEPSSSGRENRRYARYTLDCPIEFSGDLIDGDGRTADISKLGCKVQSVCEVKVGTYMNLRIHLEGEPVPLKIELAVVRWARETEFGTEFIRIHRTQKARLDQLLKFLEMLPKQDSTD